MNTRASFVSRLIKLMRLGIWLLTAAWTMRTLNQYALTQRHAILQKTCQKALDILGVQLHIATPAASIQGGRLVVANHISWLDILAITTLIPSGFIAMKEMQTWPILGKIASNIGTVFIDRRSRRDIDPINQSIAQVLSKGENVCFFPEARTSLGNGVLPLKAALFESAIMSRAAIQPIALRYYDALHQRTEAVSFADIGLPLSLWKIISLSKIEIRIDFGAALWPQTLPEIDRFYLKDQVESFLKHKVLEDSPNPDRLLP